MAARPRSLSRASAATATLLLGATLLALGLRPAIAQFSSSWDVALASGDAETMRRAALEALAANAPDKAQLLARSSLEAMPWNQSSLTILSLGQPGGRGVAALNLSAALGWRDTLTNVRLFEAAMAERQPAIAAERVDALGRTSDAVLAGRLADRLLALPGGTEALAGRAAHHLGVADWLQKYLATPPSSPAVAMQRAALVARLDPDDGAWRRAVVGKAMMGFAAAGLRGEGYALWAATLAEPELYRGQAIYDPRFTRLGQPMPLGGEWSMAQTPAASADPADGGGVVLNAVGSDPGRVLGNAIAPPDLGGSFTATWVGEEAAVRSYAWELSCASGGPVPLQRTLKQEAGAWLDQYNFTPGAGCATGYLALSRIGRGESIPSVRLNSIESGARKPGP